jgi:Flp pilus assembly protein TadG
MRLSPRRLRRNGSTAVEFAMVCPVVLLLLFGIIDYCRLLMTKQVAENAAREGARYALARTDTEQTQLTATQIEDYVKFYIGQSGSSLDPATLTVKVYKANQAGQPLDVNGAVVADPANAAAFDQTRFGEYICVSVTGEYNPLFPIRQFLPPPTSGQPVLPVGAISVMCSEGN